MAKIKVIQVAVTAVDENVLEEIVDNQGRLWHRFNNNEWKLADLPDEPTNT